MTLVVLFFFADQESLISPGNTSRASAIVRRMSVVLAFRRVSLSSNNSRQAILNMRRTKSPDQSGISFKRRKGREREAIWPIIP